MFLKKKYKTSSLKNRTTDIKSVLSSPRIPPREVRRDYKLFTRNVVAIDRVGKVTKGGKQRRYRALVVYGDKKGSVSVGVASARVTYSAIQKAQDDARKNIITVPITSSYSIPHSITSKFGGAKILLLPSAPGSGVIAGSSIRAVLELAGVRNVLSKRLGSNSLINNARATLQGLARLKTYRNERKKS